VVHELRVRLECEAEGLDADQLALAVEVGRDDDLVGLFGERAHRLGDALL
jgi:hypothetical protein